MELYMRNYQNEEDYWRIRAFLRRVFLLNNRRELSWPAARLDYYRWHGIMNIQQGNLEKDIFLWETAGGEIAAVLNNEGPGQVFLQVHPDYRTLVLEEELLEVAEEHLTHTGAEGEPYLVVWCHSQDEIRQAVLKRRNYRLVDKPETEECQYSRDLAGPIAEVRVPAGFMVRALGGEDELPSRSWASWRAFHPQDPDEDYEGWEWYLNIQKAPMYRRDLDIVAITPDGQVAAFTTVWFDDVTRSAYFEPVGTVPEHQRKGLGKAVMTEGLRRLQERMAVKASVAGFTPAAKALYGSVMGKTYEVSQPWLKKS